MPPGMKLGLSPGDFALDGDTPPPQKGGGAPKFLAHVYYAQTVGCITMPLAMEVGLSSEDFAFEGDPAPLPKKGAEPAKGYF